MNNYTDQTKITKRADLLEDRIKKAIFTTNAYILLDEGEELAPASLVASADGTNYKPLNIYSNTKYSKDQFVIFEGKTYKALKATTEQPNNATDENWELIQTKIAALNELYADESGVYNLLLIGEIKADLDENTKFTLLKNNIVVL